MVLEGVSKTSGKFKKKVHFRENMYTA